MNEKLFEIQLNLFIEYSGIPSPNVVTSDLLLRHSVLSVFEKIDDLTFNIVDTNCNIFWDEGKQLPSWCSHEEDMWECDVLCWYWWIKLQLPTIDCARTRIVGIYCIYILKHTQISTVFHYCYMWILLKHFIKPTVCINRNSKCTKKNKTFIIQLSDKMWAQCA